jgi:hypothetical protein
MFRMVVHPLHLNMIQLGLAKKIPHKVMSTNSAESLRIPLIADKWL